MRAVPWLVAAAGFWFSGQALGSPADGSVLGGGGMQGRYEHAYLHTQGVALVAADGRKVVLRGTNLGGWLVTEAWMCGFVDSQDTAEVNGPTGVAGRSTLESLEARFGPEKAAALMDVWRDHWMTTRDLDQISDAGFNLVRVPISYRTLQTAQGDWILDAKGRIDFSRMDWIVQEAAKRGIYTIFDLHVWPEQRRAYDKIGRPEGRAIRDAMAELWTAVAAHYRGNGAVAALDLINEFPGAWGVQQALSRAVSKGDPERIQVVEGFTLEEFLKLRAAGEFPNSIFSDHLYAADPLDTETFKTRLKGAYDPQTPIYIGEFLAADFKAAAQAMDQQDISWSSWTYKTVDMGDWGIFNYYAQLKTDIQTEPYAQIHAKWAKDLTSWQSRDTTHNWTINPTRILRNAPVFQSALE